MKKTILLALVVLPAIALPQKNTYTCEAKDLYVPPVPSEQITFISNPLVDASERFGPSPVLCNIKADERFTHTIAVTPNGMCALAANTIQARNAATAAGYRPILVSAGSAMKNVYFADQWCAIPGTFNQTCLANAIAVAGNNSKIVLSSHTYKFSEKLTLRSLLGVTIEGSGLGSAIVMNGPSLECDDCTLLDVHGIAFNTATTPTVVTPAMLPTTPTTKIIVLDRFNQGFGYIPSPKDPEAKKYSSAQLAEAFDTGIIIKSGHRVHIWGNTGLYWSIFCYDTSDSMINDNTIKGGGKTNHWGAIGIFPSVQTGSTPTNFRDSIVHNHVSYSSFSGIVIAAGNDAVIASNDTTYNGESGIKTNQISGSSTNEVYTHVTILGNTSKYNEYDGLDLGSTYPHIGTQHVYSSATMNVSSFNNGTGVYGDGHDWTFTENELDNNRGVGLDLDFCDSDISNNLIYHNGLESTSTQNAAIDGAGSALTGCGGSSYMTHNILSGNSFVKGTEAQYALYNVGENFLSANVTVGGPIYDATGMAIEWNNSTFTEPHIVNTQAADLLANSPMSQLASSLFGHTTSSTGTLGAYSLCIRSYITATSKSACIKAAGLVTIPAREDR